MPRAARTKSESGFYHVIAKGNGGQNLFEDAVDYRAFLDYLSEACRGSDVGIIAYCLMSNHIHLLLEDPDDLLSQVMREVMTSYALRFNSRSGHSGHVFQQRFKSHPIENEGYLLQAVRYIHNNPAKAGLCAAGEYPWSSYHEYVEGSRIVSTDLLLDMCGGPLGFLEFSASSDEAGYRFPQRYRISDAEAAQLARQILGDVQPGDLGVMERAQRNALLCALKEEGLSIAQIGRLTGLGRNVIARAK